MDFYWRAEEGKYKLYFFKAEETRMADLDYYDTEPTMRVAHFEVILGLLNVLEGVKKGKRTSCFDQRTPDEQDVLKGIFENPNALLTPLTLPEVAPQKATTFSIRLSTRKIQSSQ